MRTKPVACPCLDAHRRLMDLHEDIHRAIESYLDENEFRRWLNAAIQNSRAVTFLLQKRKAKWDDFDEWYEPWQSAAKANPILSWGVTSRNRIVKEEDLQTYSQAIISYYGERVKEAEDVVSVPPRTTVSEMLHVFAAISKAKPAHRKGWIRVQRRWIDDRLPDYELISALREIYASVAHIVERAHIASGISGCLAPAFNRSCVRSDIDSELDCLGHGDPIPSGMIDVSTGELMSFGYGRIERDDSVAEVGRKRYGLMPATGVDAIEHAESRMELSKRFLEVDGYAGPMLLLFRGVDEIRMHPLTFDDSEPRELKVAATVELEGAWPFDGAVFASETWLASPGGRGSLVGLAPGGVLPSNDEFFNSDAQGNRDEALIVEALTADGRSRVMVLPFARTKEGIVYGVLMDDSSGTVITSFLRPIWRRWPKWKKGPPPA